MSARPMSDRAAQETFGPGTRIAEEDRGEALPLPNLDAEKQPLKLRSLKLPSGNGFAGY